VGQALERATSAELFRPPPLAERRVTDMLLRQVAARPEAPFLHFVVEDVSWTYRSFADDVARVGAGIRALGLEPGERIGIMLENQPEYVLTWFGSLFAGTIDVAINHGLTGSRLAHQLRVAEVKALVCGSEGAHAVAQIVDELPDLRTLVTVEPGAPSTRLAEVPFRSLMDFGSMERHPSPTTGIATIRYTSGTTGPARAVPLPHSRYATLSGQFVWLTGYTAEDRLYTSFPLHHGIASGLGVVTTIIAGGHVTIDKKFSASRYWARIREAGATIAHVIDPLIPILLAQPESPADRDHQCARMWTAIPNDEFTSRFGPTLIYFYGQSEGGAIALIPPGETAPSGSSGRAAGLYEFQVVDEDDYPLPPNEIGEIVWRPTEPHMMMPGYVGDPESTVRACQNLWFHSGDAGRVDENGYLFLIGRMGDQIRRKGVNISAEDIESAATEHESVVLAAAVAVESELGESEIKLSVVTDAERFDVADLRAFLEKLLPSEMVPRFIEVRPDLPTTDTHKVRKTVLREEGITSSTVDFEAYRARTAGP
jgi:crotonobetaine/carnitine-CoA ligase